MVRIHPLPPSNSPAVWLGFCLAEGGVKKLRSVVRASRAPRASTKFPSFRRYPPQCTTSTSIAAKPCRGDPSGVSAASTPPTIPSFATLLFSYSKEIRAHYPLATDRAVALRKGVIRKSSDRWFVRAAPHTLRPISLLFSSTNRYSPKILSRRSPAEGTPPGFRQHPPTSQRSRWIVSV